MPFRSRGTPTRVDSRGGQRRPVDHDAGASFRQACAEVSDGLIAALVGSAAGVFGSLIVAMIVLRRTRIDNSELAREQASLDAARRISTALHQVSERIPTTTKPFPDSIIEQLRGPIASELRGLCIEYAPAVMDVTLRDAVEETDAVLLNFTAQIYQGNRQLLDERQRLRAGVQAADYFAVLIDALVAYRQGAPIRAFLQPGWRRHGGRLHWRVPLGQNIDGSGSAEPGWKRSDIGDEPYWIFESIPNDTPSTPQP